MNAPSLSTAPGKIVLAGEYAVLEGHAGLAMAIDYQVRCYGKDSAHFSIHNAKGQPITANVLVQQVCSAFLCHAPSLPPLDVYIDSHPLHVRIGKSRQKLGLGSSAAVVVALSRLLCAKAGLDDTTAYGIAQNAHRAYTGGLGSGIDIASSFYGGLIRYQRAAHGRPSSIVQLKPSCFAQNILVVYTGGSQKTTPFLEAVQTFKAQSRHAYEHCLHRIVQATRQIDHFISHPSVTESSWLELCAAVNEHRHALFDLGNRAGINVVTKEHEQLAQMAHVLGGAAKPAGAGGGDIALCFIPQDRLDDTLSQLREKENFTVLSKEIFVKGSQYT